MERLDKVVAEYTPFSRKDVRKLIRDGRIEIDGRQAEKFDQKVDDDSSITVDGEKIERRRRIVALLHKPSGFVTSVSDPRDRTVMELVPEIWRNFEVYPVGRLDKDTEGLLIFTNDGALAHSLISPKHGVEKEYYVEHPGCATEDDVKALLEGVVLDDEKTRPAFLIPEGEGRSRVIVTEGKYHLVRRIMASRGLPVTYLRRDREGSLTLGSLKKGEWRELEKEEEKLLLESQKKSSNPC